MFERFRSASNLTDLLTAPVTQGGIPKVIHIVWIGGRPFPAEYKANFRTWSQHNPDYTVRLWTEKNLPYMNTQWVLDALAKNPLVPIAARVDLIRLELLARHGGIYTDADSRCTKPLGPLVEGLSLFGMMGNKGAVQNATLGASVNHPAYRLLQSGIESRYMRLAYLNRNTTTGYEIFDLFGTRYITPVLRQFPDYEQIDQGALKGSRRLICVEGQDTLDDAYIVHSNDVSWKTGQPIKLNSAYPLV